MEKSLLQILNEQEKARKAEEARIKASQKRLGTYMKNSGSGSGIPGAFPGNGFMDATPPPTAKGDRVKNVTRAATGA